MAARDKRVSLMNEVMSSIRMLKFMAWEAPFEKRILNAREEELKQQRRIYTLEIAFDFIYSFSPVACVVVAFYVYTSVQGNRLIPSVAFASLAIFNELKFAINIIPDILINALQSYVSIKRIDEYLGSPEVVARPAIEDPSIIAFRSATVTWPTASGSLSSGTTPNHTKSFAIRDMTIDFVPNELNLICGPLGGGKTLLLLGSCTVAY